MKRAGGITEVAIGTVVLRQGKADPRDASSVDEIIYITPSGIRHCVDRHGEHIGTDIWDVIRQESNRAENKSRRRRARVVKA